jgi:FdrA protein
MNDKDAFSNLLSSELTVINIGLESFAQDLEKRGTAVLHLDWSPPAGGDPKLADLLSRLGA